MAIANGVVEELSHQLPETWKTALLIQPSSAAAEQVFSPLKSFCFGRLYRNITYGPMQQERYNTAALCLFKLHENNKPKLENNSYCGVVYQALR
jgi:hypothetical protein